MLNHSHSCHTLSPFPHFSHIILSQLFNNSKINIYISLTIQILFTTEPSHSCLRLLCLFCVTHFLKVDNWLILVSFLCAFFILPPPAALLCTCQHCFPNGKITCWFTSSPMSLPQDFNPRKCHPLVVWLLLVHLHKSLLGLPLASWNLLFPRSHICVFTLFPFLVKALLFLTFYRRTDKR